MKQNYILNILYKVSNNNYLNNFHTLINNLSLCLSYTPPSLRASKNIKKI